MSSFLIEDLCDPANFKYTKLRSSNSNPVLYRINKESSLTDVVDVISNICGDLFPYDITDRIKEENSLIKNFLYESDEIANEIAGINKTDSKQNNPAFFSDLAFVIVKLYSVSKVLESLRDKLKGRHSTIYRYLSLLDSDGIDFVNTTEHLQYKKLNKSLNPIVLSFLNKEDNFKGTTKERELYDYISKENLQNGEKTDIHIATEICFIINDYVRYTHMVTGGTSNIIIKHKDEPYYISKKTEIGLLNYSYFKSEKVVVSGSVFKRTRIPLEIRKTYKTELHSKLNMACVRFENCFGKGDIYKTIELSPLKYYPTEEKDAFSSSKLYKILTDDSSRSYVKLSYYVDFLDFYSGLLETYLGFIYANDFLFYINTKKPISIPDIKLDIKSPSEQYRALYAELKKSLVYSAHKLPYLGIKISDIIRNKDATDGIKKRDIKNFKFKLNDEGIYMNIISKIITLPKEIYDVPNNKLDLQLLFLFRQVPMSVIVDKKEFESYLKEFSNTVMTSIANYFKSGKSGQDYYNFITKLFYYSDRIKRHEKLIVKNVNDVLLQNRDLFTTIEEILTSSEKTKNSVVTFYTWLAKNIQLIEKMLNTGSLVVNTYRSPEDTKQEIYSALKKKYNYLLIQNAS